MMSFPMANPVSMARLGRGDAGSQCSEAGEGYDCGKEELIDLHVGSFSVMVLVDAPTTDTATKRFSGVPRQWRRDVICKGCMNVN